MPMYGFKCDKCGAIREEQIAVGDRDKITFYCHRCKDAPMSREVGCGGFTLKGTCWSRDGYARVLGDDPRWGKEEWRNNNES